MNPDTKFRILSENKINRSKLLFQTNPLPLPITRHLLMKQMIDRNVFLGLNWVNLFLSLGTMSKTPFHIVVISILHCFIIQRNT